MFGKALKEEREKWATEDRDEVGAGLLHGIDIQQPFIGNGMYKSARQENFNKLSY